MKKILSKAMVLILLVCMLSAFVVAEQPSGEEKTKLTIWSMSRADLTFIEPYIKKYNETNTDGVELIYEIYTDNFFAAVDVAAATGGPDIIDFPNTLSVFTNYVGQGYYLPIDDLMSDDDKALWGDFAIEGITAYDGKMYMYPSFATTGRLIYNQDIFDRVGIESPPKTLSEMVEYATLITEKLSGEGIYGFAANFKSPTGALQRSMNFLIELSGGPNQGFNYKTGKYDFSTHYADFIAAYRHMFQEGISFPGCESLDIDPLRTLFAAGKIGMYISWTHAEPGVYATQFPTDQNWNGAMLPIIDGHEMATQNVLPIHGYLITRDCKNPELAWKAIKAVFYDPEYLRAYQAAGLGSILNSKVAENAELPEMLIGKEIFLMQPTDVIWPAVPQEKNSQAVLVEGEDMYATIFSLIMGNQDIESTLKDLTDRYNQAYEKGISQGIGHELLIPEWDPKNPM